MLTSKKHIISISLLAIILIAASFFLASLSKAALVGNTSQVTLSLSPQTGIYNINGTFAVTISVNTNNQNVLAVGAYLNFDATKFQVTSISTTGTVFPMEIENTYNNTTGKIKITRGATSAFATANGLVATINLRAIAAVSPSSDNLTFDFTPGSTIDSGVVKDDGLGTDILSGVYNGQYTVKPATGVTYIFTKPLYFGISNAEVRKLQELLAADKIVYPEGLITGYFGPLTQKAVQRFQCKYEIVCSGTPQTTGYGHVGPKTRAKLNEIKK